MWNTAYSLKYRRSASRGKALRTFCGSQPISRMCSLGNENTASKMVNRNRCVNSSRIQSTSDKSVPRETAIVVQRKSTVAERNREFAIFRGEHRGILYYFQGRGWRDKDLVREYRGINNKSSERLLKRNFFKQKIDIIFAFLFFRSSALVCLLYLTREPNFFNLKFMKFAQLTVKCSRSMTYFNPFCNYPHNCSNERHWPPWEARHWKLTVCYYGAKFSRGEDAGFFNCY